MKSKELDAGQQIFDGVAPRPKIKDISSNTTMIPKRGEIEQTWR